MKAKRAISGAACAATLLLASAAGAQDPLSLRAIDAPVWGASPRLVEEVRIGTLDGAEEYAFGRVDAVAVGRDGAIWVADAQVPIIRVYDAQGKFVRNVGRRGEGPGEYSRIGGLKALPDGRFALWDNRNRRITVYSAAGVYVTSHPVQSSTFASDVFQVDRDGHFYVRTSLPPATRDTHDRPHAWLHISPTGAVVDTIRIPSDVARAPSFVLITPSGADSPFTRERASAMSSLGYLIVGDNERYSFELRRRGVPPLRIERPHTALLVTRPERDEWERWARYFERDAATPPTPNAAPVVGPPRPREGYMIPDTKPAYKDFRADAQGRIWVRPYVEAERRPPPARPSGDTRPVRQWREPPVFDVFEPTGRFVGTVRLPWNAYVHDATDRHIWATVRGDADETYVVRLRIEPSGR